MSARATGTSDTRAATADQAAATDTKRQARLSVNISRSTEEALLELAKEKNITMTEALRRLVGYGSIVYRAISKDNGDVLIRKNGETERILLVE